MLVGQRSNTLSVRDGPKYKYKKGGRDNAEEGRKRNTPPCYSLTAAVDSRRRALRSEREKERKKVSK